MTKQRGLTTPVPAFRAAIAFAALGTLLAGAGCGRRADRDDGTETKSGALTAAQIRILGFETPTADWTAPSGVLGQSTTRSQGSFSASVRNNGWTEVTSKPISSLGPVGAMISYDIRLPQTASWGEARMIVRLPSKGIFWQDLGIVPLTGMPAGVFHKATFAIPPALQTAMSSA